MVGVSNISAEREQYHRASTSIPFEEARWFSLGLLSPRLHHFCRWYPWPPASEWSCPPGEKSSVASNGSLTRRLKQAVLTDFKLGSCSYGLSHSLSNGLEDHPNTRGRAHRDPQTDSRCRECRRAADLALPHGSGAYWHNDGPPSNGATHYASGGLRRCVLRCRGACFVLISPT